jgi:uncharacterized protein (DUF1697 family)
MPRYIAFLRAINVGGHTVTMETLRSHFSAMGFKAVETFIASGNVIFETASKDLGALERNIELQLHKALGFEVKTFLRTPEEVAAIAKYQAFPKAAVESAGAYCVGFLSASLSSEQKNALMDLKTEIDDFHLHGHEIYWLCKVKQSESKFSNALMERKLKTSATFRGVNTIARLAAKLGE